MPSERPFLTASWTELVMLNFAVPGEVIARLAPPGTEPDFFAGEAYLSVVGFMFRDARFFGLGLPWHSRFEEVNLRYYVRREVGDAVRRGVVFVREIAPRPLVAATARWLYNENYVTRRMRNRVRLAGSVLAAGDRVEYEWRTGRGSNRRWNRMAARAAAAPKLPEPDTLTEYIAEHYWAYVHTRDGGAAEYRVAHRPWRVAPAEEVVWDCDLAATYGRTALAEYLAAPPVLAFVADGSPVQVFPGARIDAREVHSVSPRLPQRPEVHRRPLQTECVPGDGSHAVTSPLLELGDRPEE